MGAKQGEGREGGLEEGPPTEEEGQTGIWLGSLRRKRSESESTNGTDACRTGVWDLSFAALQRQQSSSGSVY